MAKGSQRVNPKKLARVRAIDEKLISSVIDCFTGVGSKMKFNFHYFDETQFHEKSLSDLSADELLKLWHQLKNLSEKSIVDWLHEGMPTPKSARYRNYKDFPSKSKYTPPKHVPEYAEWVAFRLSNLIRLCGFVIPTKYNGEKVEKDGIALCSNTFYVVFYDHDHGFYLTK